MRMFIILIMLTLSSVAYSAEEVNWKEKHDELKKRLAATSIKLMNLRRENKALKREVAALKARERTNTTAESEKEKVKEVKPKERKITYTQILRELKKCRKITNDRKKNQAAKKDAHAKLVNYLDGATTTISFKVKTIRTSGSKGDKYRVYGVIALTPFKEKFTKGGSSTSSRSIAVNVTTAEKGVIEIDRGTKVIVTGKIEKPYDSERQLTIRMIEAKVRK